jgi:hypothetical protein
VAEHRLRGSSDSSSASLSTQVLRAVDVVG